MAARDRDGASRAPRPASAVLGPDHSLSRAIEGLDTALKQWRAVAAVLVGSVIALVEGRVWAPTVAGSAAIVMFGLTVIGAAQAQRIRDVALDIILRGQERPIAAVQRQRRRLLCQRTRANLANNLEEIIEQATSRPKLLNAASAAAVRAPGSGQRRRQAPTDNRAAARR